MPLEVIKKVDNEGFSGPVGAPPYDAKIGTSTTEAQYVAGISGVGVDFSVIPAAAGTKILVMNAAGDSKKLYFTIGFRFTAAPTAAIELFHIRSSTGKIGNLLAGASGGVPNVRMRVGGDAAPADWSTATPLVIGTQYYLRLLYTVGDVATEGGMAAVLSTDDFDTALKFSEGITFNNGVNPISLIQFGKLSSSNACPVVFDSVAIWDGDSHPIWDDDPNNTWFYGGFLPLLPPAEYIPDAEPEIPEFPSEPEAGNEIAHTYLGKTPGETVGADEHQVFGSEVVRTYALDSTNNVVARFDGNAGANGFVVDNVAPSVPKLSFASHLIIDRLPTTNPVEIMTIGVSGTTLVGSLVLYPAGYLRFNMGATSIFTTDTLPLGERLLLQLAANYADGLIGGRVSLLDETIIGNGLLEAALPNAINGYRFGKIGTSESYSVSFDNVRSLDGSFGLILPAEEQSDAGPDLDVEPWGGPVELVGLGPGEWSQIAGPTVTLSIDGSVATFNPLQVVEPKYEVLLEFAYGTDTKKVRVLPATEAIGPINGEWLPVQLVTEWFPIPN